MKRNDAISIDWTLIAALPRYNKWTIDSKEAISGSRTLAPLILYGLNNLIANRTIHTIVASEDKNGVILHNQ